MVAIPSGKTSIRSVDRHEGGDSNSFTVLRLMLASIVFIDHLYALNGTLENYWVSLLPSSYFAIIGFFCISGFLLTNSLKVNRCLKIYVARRAARILPSYFVVVLACLTFGGLVSDSTFVDFFSDAATFQYFFAQISFLNFLQPSIPSVFEGNLYQALNGSLWTLKIEIVAYFILPFFIKIKDIVTKLIVVLFFIILVYIILSNFFTIDPKWVEKIDHQAQFFLPFFLVGSILADNNFTIEKKHLGFLLIITFIFFSNFGPQSGLYGLVVLLFPLVFVGAGQLTCPKLLRRIPDISYGVYLWHFPIIQVVIHFGIFEYSFVLGVWVCFGLTLFFSMMSFFFVERVVIARVRNNLW